MFSKKTNHPEAPAISKSEAGELKSQIPQQQIRIKPLPYPFQWERSGSGNGVAILTDDLSPLTTFLAKALMEQGFRVVVLSLSGSNNKKLENTIQLKLEDPNEETVGELIHQVQEYRAIELFIHLHPVAKNAAGKLKEDRTQLVFWMAKHLGAIFQDQKEKRCSFLCSIRLNGAFGYGSTTAFDWEAGGLSGFVKSLNREWPGVFCRTVDLHPELGPEKVVDCLLLELADTDLALAEVGYDAAFNRQTITTEKVDHPLQVKTPHGFSPNDVVLVTGGAKGITAQCTIALAKVCPCTFLLLGRSKYQEEEPLWARGISEEKSLKQAIFQSMKESGERLHPLLIQEVYQKITSSRSIKKTLEAIRNAGGTAVYVEADITDRAAMLQELSSLQQEWGKITAIVHGAGLLADKRVEKKTTADFERVYAPKVQGFLHIMDALDATRLKNIILFSSIAGFYGNEGQTDYSLANETLNKWALCWQNQHPATKVLSINWGPWNTGMITPYIQQEFRKRGVDLIPEEEGVAHFMHLLSQQKAKGVIVLNKYMPVPGKLFLLHKQQLRIKKKVLREENPFLEHHIIGEYPVMPFVAGIAWIANAAEQLFPGLSLVQCQNSKLFNGIIFNGKEAEDYYLALEVLQQDKENIRLSGKVWSLDKQERRRYHFGSEILLSSEPVEQLVRELPVFDQHPLKTKESLYNEGSLFHGPAYQGMEALWHMDEKRLWYSCKIPQADTTIAGQFPLQSSNTFATDAMCQGFLVWAFHYLKASCLPAGLGSLEVYEPLPFGETFWVHLSITERKEHKITGNATAIRTDGKVLVEAKEVVLTISKELLALYKKQTDKLAVVGMDIQLPGIPDLNAFHKAIYDGTLPVLLSSPPAAFSSSTSSYQQLRKEANSGKPQAVVLHSTFADALSAAKNWLGKKPEDSVLLMAEDPGSGSRAVVRLMWKSEASKRAETVYAVLSDGQPIISAKPEARIQDINYLDFDATLSPQIFPFENKEGNQVSSCALGTLVLPHKPLQELARLIKVSLCIHYGFLPAFSEQEDKRHFSDWDPQHFYAPEKSFPWIPENKEEKKIAGLVLKETDSATYLKLEEAAPPAEQSWAFLKRQERKLILVSGNDLSDLQEELEGLEKEAASFSHHWAEALYHRHNAEAGKYTLSLVAANQHELLKEIAFARKGLEAAFMQRKTWQTPNGSYFTAEPLGEKAKIAFVYPGLASSYEGMIKDSFQLFSPYLDDYRGKVEQLNELVHLPLVHPRYLQEPDAAERKAREAEFKNNTVAAAESGISLSVFTTKVLQKAFHLKPGAALGYSLGGISMFFALEVWGFRHLSSRVRESKLFKSDKAFQHWAHWVINAPAEKVKQQLGGEENLYLSFINSPGNVILSGERTAGEAWFRQHQYRSMRIDLFHVAHCPAVAPMYEVLYQLHLMEVEQRPEVQFYSGSSREALGINKESLAKHVADTYCKPVDFVAQVRKAYGDGFNVFIEVGPKAWCSRLIDDILLDEPHISLPTNQKGVSDYRSLLQLSSVLCSHGIPIQLPFYETPDNSLSPEGTVKEAPLSRKVPIREEEEAVQQDKSKILFTPSKVQDSLVRMEEGEALLQNLNQPCYLYQDQEFNYILSTENKPNSQYRSVGYLPARPPQQLGNSDFIKAHKLKFAYMAGAMANGIASEEMVIALGQQGLLGSFGTAGLSLERVEGAILKIREALPQGPYAFNLIHSPGDEALEMRLVKLYLQYKVRTIEASAFMEISPALVFFRAAGLRKSEKGEIVASNKIIAKVSRAGVGRLFMQPPPEALLEALVLQEKISPQQMEWAKSIPLADDITVEADSGGHTDQQALMCVLPEMIRLKERIEKRFSYGNPLRIGAAGGISTPASIVGALALGADYVVTGSINQACIEAATSARVKALLAKASSADVVLAPSADMFEMGISVQVLKWGTLYANRAKKLYQLYSQYSSLADIPREEMEKLEKQFFQKPLAEVWNEVAHFFELNNPPKLKAARQDPKKKMALVFRWYLGLSSKWAVKGVQERLIDYQVWCGPAMGAFNDWVKESPMEAIENRKVAAVAMRLLREASFLQRIQLLKIFGVPETVVKTIFSGTETENKMYV